jgi:hypothetical protein
MGQLLVPAMIGGGIGALGGAVTGNNPFKTALLGAGLGAGGAGLFGGAAGAGASGAAATGAAGSAGTFAPAIGTVAPSMLGTPMLNASLLTPGAMAGLGATPSVYGGLGASSLLDQTGAFLSNNIGNPLSSLTARDKLGLGLQGASMLNQPPQQMQTPPLMPITRGNPEMVSSPLMNVAPNVGMQQGNDIGMPNLMTRMPLTDEEKMRLQQLAQGYRG